MKISRGIMEIVSRIAEYAVSHFRRRNVNNELKMYFYITPFTFRKAPRIKCGLYAHCETS